MARYLVVILTLQEPEIKVEENGTKELMMAANVQKETLGCRLAGMTQNWRHSAAVLNIALTLSCVDY